MNDAIVAKRFRIGQRVVYHTEPSDRPSYTGKRYQAVVLGVTIQARGVRFRIEYTRDGRIVRSYVKADKLSPVPVQS